MNEPRPPRQTPQRWWIAVAVVFLFIGALALMAADGLPPMGTLLAYPVYGAYCIAVVLLAVACVRAVRRRSITPLPLVPGGLAGDRRALYGLAAFVVAVTLWREGAFGSSPAFDFNAFWAHDEMQTQSTGGGSSQTIGEGPTPRFSGRPAFCQLSCSPPGQTCEAVSSQLSCDGAGPGAVTVTGSINAPDAFCYTPWYKEATVPFSAQVFFSLSENGSNVSHNLSLSGTIRQDASGPLSCRVFRQRIGARIGNRVAQSLNEVLRSK
jgi:hypothetical protein